jgi:hypothetical protein
MPAVVDGVYKQGKIELLETPPGAREGPVRVIILDAGASKPAPRFLTFGKYHGGRMSTPDDFKDAE